MRGMVRWSLLASVVLALGFAVLGPVESSRAQLAASSPLADACAALVRDAAIDQASVHVIEVATGRVLFEHQADLALNPASNQKLVTAAAALTQLGPERRFRTSLHGSIEGSVVQRLVLRGTGDPTLTTGDVIELARTLHARGVRRVEGIVVDGSAFDAQYLPPAFDQQPREFSAFRAATAAVSIDANAYELRIRPGASVGAPAEVILNGRGYFDIDNQITTSDGGAPAIVHDQRASGERMRITLRGTIPLTSSLLSYPKRVENPLPWTGHVLADALTSVGIRVAGSVTTTGAPTEAPLLAAHTSRPLGEFISLLGKQSDNFVAEMVFRALGTERHRPGRIEDSVGAVHAYLDGARIPREGLTIVNGSGLFRGNLIRSSQLTAVLRAVYEAPGTRSEYLAHLAIAGVDGTLEQRLRDLPAPRIVRAKTGTLNDAIALSGYVLGPTPERVVAFSVLTNGVSGRHGAARNLCEGIARAVADDLWRSR